MMPPAVGEVVSITDAPGSTRLLKTLSGKAGIRIQQMVKEMLKPTEMSYTKNLEEEEKEEMKICWCQGQHMIH